MSHTFCDWVVRNTGVRVVLLVGLLQTTADTGDWGLALAPYSQNFRESYIRCQCLACKLYEVEAKVRPFDNRSFDFRNPVILIRIVLQGEQKVHHNRNTIKHGACEKL